MTLVQRAVQRATHQASCPRGITKASGDA